MSDHPGWAYRSWPPHTEPTWVPAGAEADDVLRLWLPAGTIGIYIDGSAGMEEFAWFEARYGDLPRTWASAQAPLVSVRLYRVPDGWMPRPTMFADQNYLRMQRYGVLVWPSPGWYWSGPFGAEAGAPPAFEDLAELPPTWVHALRAHPGVGYEAASPILAAPPHGVESVSAQVRRFAHQTVVTATYGHHMATADLYALYEEWCAVAPQVPPELRVQKMAFGRALARLGWEAWAGKTAEGFRRGWRGVRAPRGAWEDRGIVTFG